MSLSDKTYYVSHIQTIVFNAGDLFFYFLNSIEALLRLYNKFEKKKKKKINLNAERKKKKKKIKTQIRNKLK